mmetsp:Transcript_8215/g.23449  ORF Transcript_8215/g.23449 Transcript_8215/m.23449 type:complete len:502 (+) Transcript_8215:73-1578(+)
MKNLEFETFFLDPLHVAEGGGDQVPGPLVLLEVASRKLPKGEVPNARDEEDLEGHQALEQIVRVEGLECQGVVRDVPVRRDRALQPQGIGRVLGVVQLLERFPGHVDPVASETLQQGWEVSLRGGRRPADDDVLRGKRLHGDPGVGKDDVENPLGPRDVKVVGDHDALLRPRFLNEGEGVQGVLDGVRRLLLLDNRYVRLLEVAVELLRDVLSLGHAGVSHVRPGGQDGGVCLLPKVLHELLGRHDSALEGIRDAPVLLDLLAEDDHYRVGLHSCMSALGLRKGRLLQELVALGVPDGVGRALPDPPRVLLPGARELDAVPLGRVQVEGRRRARVPDVENFQPRAAGVHPPDEARLVAHRPLELPDLRVRDLHDGEGVPLCPQGQSEVIGLHASPQGLVVLERPDPGQERLREKPLGVKDTRKPFEHGHALLGVVAVEEYGGLVLHDPDGAGDDRPPVPPAGHSKHRRDHEGVVRDVVVHAEHEVVVAVLESGVHHFRRWT